MRDTLQQPADNTDGTGARQPIVYRVLGELEVEDGTRTLNLSGPAQKALLAYLLLNANRSVSNDAVAENLWGVEAGYTVKRLQMAVTRLRRALKPLDAGDADSVLRTVAGGYLLAVAPGALDSEVFERLLRAGRKSLEAGNRERAVGMLLEAEALWRGRPYEDVELKTFAQDEIRRLEDLRLDAIETRIEAELGLERHAELAGELESLTAAHPTREHFTAQLMIALYRCGRQAEALDAYRRLRGHLDTAFGLEPGPELQQLQTRILNHDARLLRVEPAPLPAELDTRDAVPLAGRIPECAWLNARWDRVLAGDAAIIALCGPAGSGKTRLAAELAGAVHDEGAHVVHASAGQGRVIQDTLTASSATLLVVDRADALDQSALRTASQNVPVLTILLVTEKKSLSGWPVDAVLALGPLDEAAVEAIARAYVPRASTVEPPLRRLVKESRGNPARVHELAREWAVHQSERRVELSASRTAAGRARLRSVEAELVDEVEELRTAARPGGVPDPLVCPFKGLASFQVADAPYFFGRERLVAELIARLVGASLLGIVGPSGSGKSSVLRAGLLPALAAGVLRGRGAVSQVVIRPGSHPLTELHRALEEVPAGPAIIAVDQFEETFTVCADEAERTAFIAELVERARTSDERGAVLLAIRADFYGRCANHPDLAPLLAANHVLVGAMRSDELRRAVECPADAAGLSVEPKLVDALIDDVASRPGGLPLLSTCLLELWQGLDGGRRLELAAYRSAGGVRGAVARLGEAAFLRLEEPQRSIARRVLLRLAPLDDEGGVERRRVAFAELGGDDVIRVAGLLAESRVVTIHEGTVELAHEALLREWPRLQEWIEESQDVRRVHRSLSAEAKQWDDHARDEDALLRGALLAEVQEMLDPATLAAVEREFLEASLERQRRARATRRRRLQVIFGALAAGLVAITVVALLAIDQRNEAEQERNLALSRSLALESQQMLETDPELALRLALWADETAPTTQATAALRQAALEFRRSEAVTADPQSANVVVASSDGSRLISGGDEGVARLFEMPGGRELAHYDGNRGALLGASFSRDERHIALAFAEGTVVVTDDNLEGADEQHFGADVEVRSVAFTHDGRHAAAGLSDGTARVFALDGEPKPLTLGTAAEEAAVNGVDTDALGRVAVASEDGTVRLFNGDGTGLPVELPDVAGAQQDVDFSPDQKLLLAVGDDGHARLWNARTLTQVATVEIGRRGLTAGAISPDGTRFATAGVDGAVRVWDMGSALNMPLSGPGASQLFVMNGQLSRVLDVNFAGSADAVVSSGDNGTATLWDAGGVTTFTGPTWTYSLDFSPTGRWLVTAGYDGDVRLWDSRTARPGRVLEGPDDGFTWAHFSPVADEVVFGRSPDSTVLRWRISDPTAEPIAQLGAGSGDITSRFDQTGQRVVYTRENQAGTLAVRDLRTGKATVLGKAPKEIYDLGFSHDGKHVAVATETGELLVWRLDRPEAPAVKLRGHRSHVNTVDWSSDGRIATTGDDRTVRVWEPFTGRQVVLRGHSDELMAAVFTPDGRHVISTSADGTVRYWDAAGGPALAILQSGTGVPVYDVTMLEDGTIATLDGREVVRIFRCEVCAGVERVRELARDLHPRELTPEERSRYEANAG